MPEKIKAYSFINTIDNVQETKQMAECIQSLEDKLDTLSYGLKERFRKLVASQISLLNYKHKDTNNFNEKIKMNSFNNVHNNLRNTRASEQTKVKEQKLEREKKISFGIDRLFLKQNLLANRKAKYGTDEVNDTETIKKVKLNNVLENNETTLKKNVHVSDQYGTLDGVPQHSSSSPTSLQKQRRLHVVTTESDARDESKSFEKRAQSNRLSSVDNNRSHFHENRAPYQPSRSPVSELLGGLVQDMKGYRERISPRSQQKQGYSASLSPQLQSDEPTDKLQRDEFDQSLSPQLHSDEYTRQFQRNSYTGPISPKLQCDDYIPRFQRQGYSALDSPESPNDKYGHTIHRRQDNKTFQIQNHDYTPRFQKEESLKRRSAQFRSTKNHTLPQTPEYGEKLLSQISSDDSSVMSRIQDNRYVPSHVPPRLDMDTESSQSHKEYSVLDTKHRYKDMNQDRYMSRTNKWPNTEQLREEMSKRQYKIDYGETPNNAHIQKTYATNRLDKATDSISTRKDIRDKTKRVYIQAQYTDKEGAICQTGVTDSPYASLGTDTYSKPRVRFSSPTDSTNHPMTNDCSKTRVPVTTHSKGIACQVQYAENEGMHINTDITQSPYTSLEIPTNQRPKLQFNSPTDSTNHPMTIDRSKAQDTITTQRSKDIADQAKYGENKGMHTKKDITQSPYTSLDIPTNQRPKLQFNSPSERPGWCHSHTHKYNNDNTPQDLNMAMKTQNIEHNPSLKYKVEHAVGTTEGINQTLQHPDSFDDSGFESPPVKNDSFRKVVLHHDKQPVSLSTQNACLVKDSISPDTSRISDIQNNVRKFDNHQNRNGSEYCKNQMTKEHIERNHNLPENEFSPKGPVRNECSYNRNDTTPLCVSCRTEVSNMDNTPIDKCVVTTTIKVNDKVCASTSNNHGELQNKTDDVIQTEDMKTDIKSKDLSPVGKPEAKPETIWKLEHSPRDSAQGISYITHTGCLGNLSNAERPEYTDVIGHVSTSTHFDLPGTSSSDKHVEPTLQKRVSPMPDPDPIYADEYSYTMAETKREKKPYVDALDNLRQIKEETDDVHEDSGQTVEAWMKIMGSLIGQVKVAVKRSKEGTNSELWQALFQRACKQEIELSDLLKRLKEHEHQVVTLGDAREQAQLHDALDKLMTTDHSPIGIQEARYEEVMCHVERLKNLAFEKGKLSGDTRILSKIQLAIGKLILLIESFLDIDIKRMVDNKRQNQLHTDGTMNYGDQSESNIRNMYATTYTTSVDKSVPTMRRSWPLPWLKQTPTALPQIRVKYDADKTAKHEFPKSKLNTTTKAYNRHSVYFLVAGILIGCGLGLALCHMFGDLKELVLGVMLYIWCNVRLIHQYPPIV